MYSKMIKYYITVCAFLFVVSEDLSAQAGGIYGYILDRNTGKPIEQACVVLDPDSIGAETNSDGIYFIPKIPSGRYELRVVMIGYETMSEHSVMIQPDESREMNFFLKPIILTGSDEIVVTATRGKSMTNEVPASVDVISMEKIELLAPQNMAEVLENVQGVFIKDYGGIGGNKTISLRGSSSEQVLVLLDGQRLNDAQSGQVDFSSISLEGVERIEVVRGGNSALYGADAVGGVINIITNKKHDREGISGSLKMMNGSFQSLSIEPALKIRYNKFGGSLSYKYLSSEGDFTYKNLEGRDEKLKNNDIIAQDLFARFYYLFDDSLFQRTLNFSYKYYDSERGSPGNIELPYRSARLWNTNQQFNTTFSGKVFNLMNDFQVQAYAHTGNSRYKNDEGLVPIDSRYDNGTYGLETQMQSIFTAGQLITYGAGYRNDWLNSEEFADDHTRDSYYIFLQNETEIKMKNHYPVKSLTFVPAVRLDGFSDFGSHVSPKIGGVINFGHSWQTSLKWNAGLSYRAPNFNELYWPEDAWTKGNPDLKAEHGYDWDAGIRLRYPILNVIALDVTYFDVHMNDLILWQSTGQLWMPLNVDKSRNRGIEASISLSPVAKRIMLNANYTFLDARNLSDDLTTKDKYLVYRPRHTFNTAVTINYRNLTLKYDFQYVGKRYVNPANTKFMEAYGNSDLTVAYVQDFDNWTSNLSFQVKNLLDERYQIIQYHPLPGREMRINLGISIN